MAQLEKIHLFVSGRVQGVGFRFSAQLKAIELGLGGWVRNRTDSRVEIEAQGPSDPIQKFIDWCYRGPSHSIVSRVDVISRAPTSDTPAASFEIRETV